MPNLTETYAEERRYADGKTHYEITGVSGMTDDEVRAFLTDKFGCDGFWASNYIDSYRRTGEDNAVAVIGHPYLD